MKILMINKFLHPNGGSETYIFKLGEQLTAMGHQVEFFGMEHEGRCVGNRVNAYTSDMDFHNTGKLAKLTYPLKTIYSTEARKKLRLVLEDFQPDVCHLNNFNYQLTPSVILEIVSWRKKVNKPVRILYTAHDYQLVCPNHMCNQPATGENCEKCLSGRFIHCMKGKCIHGSTAKSAIGMAEATFWKWKGVYKYIDTIICISHFMKKMLDRNPLLADKTIVLHNFISQQPDVQYHKEAYVLYFGRFSAEKGIHTLLKACRALPDIPFVFAGTGPLEEVLVDCPNIKNIGFQTGDALDALIGSAQMCICPSEWYEPFGLTIAEAITRGTPVIASSTGGIPELVTDGQDGKLFESGNAEELIAAIRSLWDDRATLADYSQNCRKAHFHTAQSYCEQLLKLYQ